MNHYKFIIVFPLVYLGFAFIQEEGKKRDYTARDTS
jgi:hypothetical protein